VARRTHDHQVIPIGALKDVDLDQSTASAPLMRAAQIIDVVSAAPDDGLPLNRITSLVGLPASTTYRLVKSLLAIGYLAQNEHHKTYHVGRRLMQVMHSAFGGRNVQALAAPILMRLVNKFGQVFYVNQLIAEHARVVAFVMPEIIQRPLVIPGEYSLIHATAGGKAIYAFQDKSVIDRQLAERLQKFLPDTITDPAAVREELARVRKRGYALTRSEYGMGVSAIAVPVEIPHAGVLYSIGVAGFDSHFFETYPIRDYVAALRSAAAEFRSSLTAAHEVDNQAKPAPRAVPLG
jgi:DNA-binding IclR family transcriptional regulator